MLESLVSFTGAVVQILLYIAIFIGLAILFFSIFTK